jgi:hypothetical protein
MNERIRELAEQCRIEEYNQHGDLIEFGFNEEKFAELIVRECMSVADLPNNASGQWDHLLSSEVIGKHFGVES